MVLFYRYIVLNRFVLVIVVFVVVLFVFAQKVQKAIFAILVISGLDARLWPNQLMAMRTTDSTESTQAKLYMYLAVPIKYYTLVWSSWAVELNNKTASVSLDSLLLQCLTTNERNIDTYLLWDLNANIIFQICALTQMWLHITLAVWLILMAIISAFETKWTDFFLFSSFFCPSKTDI